MKSVPPSENMMAACLGKTLNNKPGKRYLGTRD
jgi:hypothetical protein